MFRAGQKKQRRHILEAVVGISVLVVVITGCASSKEARKGDEKSLVDPSVAKQAEAAAKRISKGNDVHGTLKVIEDKSGHEGNIIKAMYKPFEKATGVKIKYTGTENGPAIIQSQVRSGNPPNVVATNGGLMRKYAKEKKIYNLSQLTGSSLQKNFSKTTRDSLSYNGNVYGVYQDFNNVQLWYNPKQYSGPKSPNKWSDIADWTEKLGSEDKPAWCNAQEAGASTGFPVAQFFEELFAKRYGKKATEDLANGKIPWTSSKVKHVYKMVHRAVGVDSHVHGGVAGSLSQDIGTGSNGLVSKPPKCEAVLWNTWTGGLIRSSAKTKIKAGKNLDFMPVPASKSKYENVEAYTGTATYAFKGTSNSAATKAFIKYIASPEAQKLLASANHWVVADKTVKPNVYNDELLRKTAKSYVRNKDTILAPAPSQIAPQEVDKAEQKGLVTYLKEPRKLNSVLAHMQDVAKKHQ